MREHIVSHPHNEASGLLILHNPRILDSLGWDLAFWIASDERPGHECIAALGRRRSSGREEEWEVRPLRAEGGKIDSRKTEDAESLARAGSWIYVFGSQFGAKDGPLEPPRHWIGRFNESSAVVKEDRLSAPIDIAKRPFLLHRIINDAIESSGIELLGRGVHERDDFVLASFEKGNRKDKQWRDLIRENDRPINVEAATFAPNGRLLIGLRYPVSHQGHPLLVELDGIDLVFEKHGSPVVTDVWELVDVGSAAEPRGVRELECRGSEVHVIAGDLDSSPEKSLLLRDHPEGERARSEHHLITLPRQQSTVLPSRLVRRFSRRSDIEGVVLADDGSIWYAADADEIRLFESSPSDDSSGASSDQ